MNGFRILAQRHVARPLNLACRRRARRARPSHRSFARRGPGDPKKPARTVEVVMKETEDGKMLFVPDRVEAKRGEQVRFVLKNEGQVDHEFLLDTPERNAKHKLRCGRTPTWSMTTRTGSVSRPGGTGEIVWRFSKAGTFEFACLIPGHPNPGCTARPS